MSLGRLKTLPPIMEPTTSATDDIERQSGAALGLCVHNVGNGHHHILQVLSLPLRPLFTGAGNEH